MLHLDHLWQLLTATQLIFWLLWVGLAALSVSLVVLLWTRWGQSQALGKCLVFSLIAHVLMALYATTVQLTFEPPGEGGPVMHVMLGDENAPLTNESSRDDTPWEQFVNENVVQPSPADMERAVVEPLSDPQRETPTAVTDLADKPRLDHGPPADTPPPDPKFENEQTPRPPKPGPNAAEVAATPAERREPPALPTPPAPNEPVRAAAESLAGEPERAVRPGVSAALLNQNVALPPLNDQSETVGPVDALSDPQYRLTQVTRGAPSPAPSGAAAAAANADPQSVAGPSEATAVARQHAASLTGLSGAGLDVSPSAAGTPSVDLRIGSPPLAAARRGGEQAVPERYQLRTAPNRAQLAQQQGATAETEAAVKAALAWLVAAQAADGRWDAGDHGAGREEMVLGRNRQNAGIEADTGVTGLALLAFLASGHTHERGDHRDTVRRGLEYLLRIQARDGNLAGGADNFARMYCHAMATIAVSEALGMSGDERLREPARRALAYTVACQSAATGGWRYTPADPGDTSQLGWQWMALKSGELAGIPIPERTQQGVNKYLLSVASGKAGGMAAYRPGERASRSMTAEALYCWQLLGLQQDHPLVSEASEAILGELPGVGRHNCYYWYYATLSLYQLQNDAWRQWNDALTRTLVSRQRKDGPQAGSWDTDTVWGGYGGRVYTTAISALTLEVYYRYLPLYGRAPGGVRAE